MSFRTLLVTLSALVLFPSGADAQLQFLQQWGNPGPPDPVAFPDPHAIAVGPSNRVYLVLATRWVYIYYPDGQVYTQAFTSVASHFDIAVDAAENFYVASWDNSIKRYNSSGISTGNFSGAETENELLTPMGVALDGAGNLYVADTGNYRIQKLTTDGTFILKWGSQGTGSGQFVGPVDVEVGKDGNIYVVDNGAGLRRIQVFTPDGTFVREFNYSICDGNSDIHGIAFDANNNFFAAGGSCLTKFDASGNVLYTFGSPGNGEGEFNSLYDVFVDQAGYIYTAESAGSRIQKFQELQVPTQPTTWTAIKTLF
jgi:tripartite motif-containing protein 71